MSRLALGTAQFGAHYGITNRAGQVQAQEAAAILDSAERWGIDTLDTARLYGESEHTIGQCSRRDRFRIVTKTGKYGPLTDAQTAAEKLRADFARSSEALGKDSLFALLIHDPADLLGSMGATLWKAMEDLKASGAVQKIGVSIYQPQQADGILERFPIDIVQLPFNGVDRRVLDGGQLGRLAKAGVEIHARSLFLQGLLLAQSASISAMFAPLRGAIDHLDAWCRQLGLSRLQGLLGLAFRQTEFARFVVGVTSATELNEIAVAAQRVSSAEPFELPDLPTIDARILDPTQWSLSGGVPT